MTSTAVFALLTLALVGAPAPAGPRPSSPSSGAPAVARVTFADVPPSASKIAWVHDNARSPERYLPETCNGGGAFLDYDGDGWMDVFLVNSGASDFFAPTRPLRNALYRNNHDGTFADVTDRAGLGGGQSFGMGAAAADYDGDGHQDIFVTAYGRNALYRNNGDGTFADVTERAGLAASGWFTCATWFDYDGDGRLDLFVSSFVQYSKALNVLCGDNKLNRRFYCIPRIFKPTPSRLYHGNKDGTFTDVSADSGIAGSLGKAFGAVATDVNNDGRMDLFVACDTSPNMLFVNKGGGKFEEVGLAAGVAYSDTGNPRSGMGVDAADYDGDGWQDLFVANVDQEFFSLYHNERDVTFADQPGEIGAATRLLSGWGLRFMDYDDDGDPDLFLANGHPDDMVEARVPNVRYREPLLMFENVGKTFRNVSAESGADFLKDYPARGASVGDYDNDGDLDLLVVNNGEAPLLLRNDGGNRNHWLGLGLVATKSNPAAAGATIAWEAGGTTFARLKTAGGSYLASHDPREILGLGAAAKADRVEIRWPSGTVDRLTNVPADRYVSVVEGKGIVPAK